MATFRAGQLVMATCGYKEVKGTLLPSRNNRELPRRFKNYYFIMTEFAGKLRVTNVRPYKQGDFYEDF